MSPTDMKEPLVTVGLPVYNAKPFLSQAIESILGQTFGDFRLVISDNASTDGTEEICRSFARQDARIQYHRNATNIGLPGNFNLVFGLCRSKYFRWATSDDYTSADMLARAVEVLESDPTLALCYPRGFMVDADGQELSRWKDDLHVLGEDPVERFKIVVQRIGRVHHHLGLMRASIVRKTGLLGKHVGSDIAFVAEMSLHGKFFQVPEHQFFRRMHYDSSSWATTDEAHQARRYHGSGVERVPFKQLRMQLGLVRAVRRSPLSTRDRMRAYRLIGRWARWNREKLIKEVFHETRSAAGALFRKADPSQVKAR